MEHKKDEEALAEIHRNAALALQSISDILPETDDESVRQELMHEHDEYEKFLGRACVLAKDRNLCLKSPNPLKKAMMWGSIKMNTLSDGSPSHIAEMMTQGTVMGITSLKSTLADLVEDDGEIAALLKEMIEKEELFEKRWKKLITA